MTPKAFQELLKSALPANRKVCVVGPPGVGKTYSWMQVCADLGYDLIVMCLPLDDPSTIRGYPRPPSEPNGDAVHCLFDGMARAFRATKPTVLLADDIGQASESTLKAWMRVLQFGELDGRQLPEWVRLGAATNDVGHGAGVYGMIEPLKSRFHAIVHVVPDADEVVQYGLAHNWPTWLCAFLRNCPDALNTWKPSKSMDIDGSCPRGLDYLGQWDNIGCEDTEVWSGCVGRDVAVRAKAFKRLQNDLPDIDQVILDPDNAPLPDDPGARFLITTTLAVRCDCGNFGQVLKYLKRLPQTFRAYSLKDAFALEAAKRAAKQLPSGYKAISTARDYTAWVCSPDGKEILSGGSGVS